MTTTTLTTSTTTRTMNNDDNDEDEYNDHKTTMTKTTTNRMNAVQIGEGKQLCNIVWQGCDDPTRDRIRDCVRAKRYCGCTIKHAT